MTRSLSEGGKSFSHSPQGSCPQSHRPEQGHIPIPKPISGQAHGMTPDELGPRLRSVPAMELIHMGSHSWNGTDAG